ncbi:MAG: cation/H(+) antiporter [Rhodospirillaceae bacterium]|nr:cation/H(+) antiporter [Rhodospirillaceae bacterium]
MESSLDLTGIAVVVTAATLCGTLIRRLGQPSIVGYIFAGILLGPSGLALISDRGQVGTLAELGVLMLLYFVGMELSLRSFRRSWRIAVFTALLQIVASVVLLLAFTRLFNWSASHAILFGFVLALSSTVVAIRMLEEVGELRTRVGRITVGVLVAQDLAVAPMLIVVDGMSGEAFQYSLVFKIVLSIGLLAAATLYLSRRRHVNLPLVAVTVGSVDLTPVAALTWCFGFAAIAGIMGLSPAFGAFFAGLLIGSSAQRHAVSETARPIQSVLLMVFFLSIGLLIDLQFLWDNIGLVLMLWLFIVVFKTALNTGVLRFMGETWQRAFLSSLILAQIGEFSFVLGAAAIDRQVVDADIHRLIVAVTVVSLVTSPLWLNSARRLHHRAAQHPETLGALLRLVYFREWRLTRRASMALAIFAITSIEKARQLFKQLTARRRIKTTTQIPQQRDLSALPPPEKSPDGHAQKPDA